jgi:hypothetical protein
MRKAKNLEKSNKAKMSPPDKAFIKKAIAVSKAAAKNGPIPLTVLKGMTKKSIKESLEDFS